MNTHECSHEYCAQCVEHAERQHQRITLLERALREINELGFAGSARERQAEIVTDVLSASEYVGSTAAAEGGAA